MNVLAVTGLIVDSPLPCATPDGDWCEFRLAIDLMPWLDFLVRVTACTIATGGTPAVGRRVSVLATLRREDWVVRDGTRMTCWSVEASAVTVLDDRGRGETGTRAH